MTVAAGTAASASKYSLHWTARGTAWPINAARLGKETPEKWIASRRHNSPHAAPPPKLLKLEIPVKCAAEGIFGGLISRSLLQASSFKA
jgi:hypothetical protein